MRCFSVGLTVAAFGVGLVAALFWYRASKNSIIPIWARAGVIEPVSPDQALGGWISGILEASQEAAR
jgi:hypothetical protein